MDSRFPLGQLDRSVESTVKRLDQMLVQLDGYRPLLEQNVTCAEFDIRATFDSLICALGQRQMQLLKQLDKIAKEKTIVIENQRQMIENLRANIVACMSNRNKNIGQIQEYLSRAESAILNSSSAPFVSFRTEKSVMHQTVSSYGRIISQYCGHFADPSQPSSCLPRALEEEDENDESVDCGYRAQSMVFNRIHAPSSHIKPDLLQWLSEEHSFDNQNRGQSEQKMGFSALSGLPLLHSGLESQSSTPSHMAKSVGCHPNNQTVMSFPFRSCDPLLMRHWLDTNPALKELNKSKESTCRKFSQTTSLGSSDGTGATDSESFVALTGSTIGRLGSFKDWMCFDPLELCEIPGLSASDQSRSVVAPPSQTPSDWLIWLTPASAEHVPDDRLTTNSINHRQKDDSRPASLLPTHLTQSGVLDVDRWIAKSNQSEPTQDGTPCPMLAADREPTNEVAVPSETPSMVKKCFYSSVFTT
ncbi:unnamed protein product [Echinostoma caproni]|uniref:Uncharacterized protein n=1 Tax=Echinostoma caproni TaxID=27848 RepID=A0A183AV11_9TREM|nr:unnamed protein product [Echinostoma caproni]